MGETPDGDHAAVAARGLVIASEVVLAKLRDPDFLALGAGSTPPGVVTTASPDGDGPGGSGWRSLAREGGERARSGLASGLEKLATRRPGTAHWAGLTVDQRCEGWVATLGRATAVLAALPGLTGALGETLPVGELISTGRSPPTTPTRRESSSAG